MNEIKQTITNEATQDERRTATENDRLVQKAELRGGTFHERAIAEAGLPGGRFTAISKTSVAGASPVPQYPSQPPDWPP